MEAALAPNHFNGATSMIEVEAGPGRPRGGQGLIYFNGATSMIEVEAGIVGVRREGPCTSTGPPR